MEQIELIFNNDNPNSEKGQIIMAQLFEMGAEGVFERENDFSVFFENDFFHQNKESLLHYLSAYTYQLVAHGSKNWNSEWEKNYHWVDVDHKVIVYAPFHADVPQYQYKILINPGMAFGTGHHATTMLMIKNMLQINFIGKSVIDMGCGSGVLAILAKQLGAESVIGIDNDLYAYNNSLENVQLNECNIPVYHGDAAMLKNHTCEIFLANITRNILLRDISVYTSVLKTDGYLILSGFLLEDINAITDECQNNGLIFHQKQQQDEWISLMFKKL